MDNSPSVTIIVLNWNGEEYVAKCLDSLLHQTYPNYELIVVDNGSTDGSVELLNGYLPQLISRSDGLILLIFFIIFLAYVFGISKIEGRDRLDLKTRSWTHMCSYCTIGLIGLFAGGKLVVDSAVNIARWCTVSEKLIGLTVVSIGTSLPELFTSAIAAHKRKSDIAIGNILGSSIFNIFFIMGISALIAPINFQPIFTIDLLILIGASMVLFITMFTGEKRSLDRWEAVLFIVLYTTYSVYLLIRR